MRRSNLPSKLRFIDRREVPLAHARDRQVLHIGMGTTTVPDSKAAGGFRPRDLRESLHARLSRVAGELTGIDIDAAKINAMRAVVPGRYIVADIADSALPSLVNARYERVMFLEVLQDVSNPRQALLNVREMLHDDGELILSTDNAFCLDRFAKLAFGYESVYPDHLCYFSYMTMKQLLNITGFDVDSVHYTYLPRTRSGSLAGRLVLPIERAICRVLPQFGEGILMVARPRH